MNYKEKRMYKNSIFFSGTLLLVVSLFCCFCSKKKDETKAFAKVGRKVISQESFDAFKRMKRFYPGNLAHLAYPGERSFTTLCVETEAIYPKARSARAEVKNSNDWKWKKNFFHAQMYLLEVLDKNLGFADREIEAYYNKNKERFKKVIKVKVTQDTTASEEPSPSDSADTSSTDTTSKEVYKDSTIYRPLNAARGEIAQTLFAAKYPPDSAFYASKADSTGKFDSADVQTQWVMKERRNLPEFFMKKVYKKRYGKEYPEPLNVDSVNDIVGEGKIITPEDMDVIYGWLPEGRREGYKTAEKKLYLAGWLLKWLMFSEEAKEIEFDKTNKDVKLMVDNAWKFEVVVKYVNDVLVPQVEKEATVDTAMCIFKAWDRSHKPGTYPDSTDLNDAIKPYYDLKVRTALEGKIYAIRKKVGVKFLQSDFTDDKVEDPVKLAAEADSLYGEGSSKEAEKKYKMLADNFLFTGEGKNALVELAKILTENEKYRDAVNRYRQFLQFSPDREKRCNIFFMIGFVYSEYLSKPELAEANYKWILKNTPECELADDAEFMCLHLAEPMIGVDELQAEAKRQGRKPEEAEPVSEVKEEAGTSE